MSRTTTGNSIKQSGRDHSVDSLILQPWFLPAETARTIRKLLPANYATKMIDYFAKYGCIHCHRKTVPYNGNGLCQGCAHKIKSRLAGCVRIRLRATKASRFGRKFLQDARCAGELLKGFPSRMFRNTKQEQGTRNPARDAFVILNE